MKLTDLAAAQEAVVIALLDQIDRLAPWRAAFVHAEFAGGRQDLSTLAEAFLVEEEASANSGQSFPLDIPVENALCELWGAFDEFGQPFQQLDLEVLDAAGRYRFQFSDEPSLRLNGSKDPTADLRLDDAYQRLARGEGRA